MAEAKTPETPVSLFSLPFFAEKRWSDGSACSSSEELRSPSSRNLWPSLEFQSTDVKAEFFAPKPYSGQGWGKLFPHISIETQASRQEQYTVYSSLPYN